MKFLYYDITELWGHRGKALAGKGKTGVSEVRVWLEKPPYNLKA